MTPQISRLSLRKPFKTCRKVYKSLIFYLTVFGSVNIDLENIVKGSEAKKEERFSRYLPTQKISKTLCTVKDSLRSVYPEYYIIFSGCIDTWNVYKEPVLSHLNTGKEYVIGLYKFLVGQQIF